MKNNNEAKLAFSINEFNMKNSYYSNDLNYKENEIPNTNDFAGL